MVHRARLIERLEQGSLLPVTVVTGPPGSGKTSLLSSWAGGEAPVAWVSLERVDADAPRFWSTVIGAIEASGNGDLAADLRALPRDRADFLAGFANRLDGGGEATPVIVLDDFQELHGSAVTGEIDALLRHPPAGLRLVIASRADPVLALRRLRMLSQLTELRTADLAFTEPEAAELFSQAGIELEADEVEALVRETEGWAGGLRLAALSLAHEQRPAEFIRDFAGDDQAVSAYLVEQALDSQPDEIREFMLRTSIVDAISSDLADALTGNSDGARILERLVRGNVFLSARGQPQGWYRYHRMFRELLRAQLRHRLPHVVALANRRAAQWYARNDLYALSARHALAGGDSELAGRALCRGWLKLLLEGQTAAIAALIPRLPEGVVARDPELAMAAASLLFQSGRPEEARGFVALGEHGASGVDPRRRRQWLLSRTVAQILDGRSTGDFELVAAGAEKLLAGLGADVSELDAADRRAFALLQLGVAQTWLGEPARALASLEEALALALHASRDHLACAALAALALHHARAGELRRAEEKAVQAFELDDRHDWSGGTANDHGRLALAICAYHRGHSAEARRELDALGDGQTLEPPIAVSARILRARLQVREGRPDLARMALASIRRGLDGPPLRTTALDGIAHAEAEALCALGSGEDAQAAIASGPGACALDAELVRARLALAAGTPELVTAAGTELCEREPAHTGRAIELLALTAVAHHQCGDDDAALEFTEKALERADRDGHVDPFLAVGRPVRSLLARRIRAGTRHRALAGAIVERLDPQPSAPARESRTLLLEPLSERELTVLRYLPTPLSKSEIASEMCVTVNTIKTHVKSIYRKLDVGNRLEAVRRARALALI